MLNRQIHRQYRAIVCGKTEKEGIIDAPIGRAEDSTVLRRIDFEHGETARTRYRLLSYDEEKDLSYISLKLDTGRTHQIRVHMSYIGHPLPGDFLYNPDYRYISRQPLHSYGLEFIHPLTGEPLSFTAHLPADMAALVKSRNLHPPKAFGIMILMVPAAILPQPRLTFPVQINTQPFSQGADIPVSPVSVSPFKYFTASVHLVLLLFVLLHLPETATMPGHEMVQSGSF